MLPPCTQQKYCTVPESQELPPAVWGCLEWAVGLSLPSWPGGVPALSQSLAGFHQHPLHLVFPQDDMMAVTTEREQEEAARSQVVQELEVIVAENSLWKGSIFQHSSQGV